MNSRFLFRVFICIALILCGCATTNLNKLSQQSIVPQEVLAQNCSGINCSYDDLEDRLQVSAYDTNVLYALSGYHSWSIGYVWVSSWDQIKIEVATTGLYTGWKFVKSADIYVGKEKVASLNDSHDQIVGKYNDVAREHELIEIVNGFVNKDVAERIALAPRENVTIRFYGKDGYTDEKIKNEHSLIQVVNIAKSK